jgi:hypothetical protein
MGAMASPPSFARLEQAASHIIHLIRNTRGLEHTRLAVIGDLAVRKYLPKYEHTKVSSSMTPSPSTEHSAQSLTLDFRAST